MSSFEGSIGEIDLIQRLVELSRERFTGAIRFEQDGVIKIVYFKDGDVLSASTNDRKDAVDEILLRAGKISREHIKQALSKRQENETLGDSLLNLGFITRKELAWARRIQVIGILRSVRAWTDGSYAIVADYLPKREEGTIFSLPQIIVEFMVTEQDKAPFDRAMDGGDAVFHKTPAFDAAFPALDLNEDANEIVAQVDGTKSAADIAAASGAEAFNVYKLLEALRMLGLIEKGGFAAFSPQPAHDDLGFESAGVADASEAWNATPVVEEAAAPPEPAWNFQPQIEEPPPPPPPPPPVAEAPKVPYALKLDDEQPQMPATPPEPSLEQRWGFDEAQIETAERAHAPARPAAVVPPKRVPIIRPVAKPKKRGGDRIYMLIVSLLFAGAIVGAWWWWHNRTATPAPAPVATKRPANRPVFPAPKITPPPLTPEPTSSGAQPSSAVQPPTQTVAPTPAPAPVPTPTPATTTTAEPPKAASRLEQTTTGRVITNAPAEPAANDNNRTHYDQLAQQYAKNATGNYTVQFELVCQTSSLAKAVAAGGSNVWFVPIAYRNHACYRVFWGHYNTRDEALAALDGIPSQLRAGTPVVVAVPHS